MVLLHIHWVYEPIKAKQVADWNFGLFFQTSYGPKIRSIKAYRTDDHWDVQEVFDVRSEKLLVDKPEAVPLEEAMAETERIWTQFTDWLQDGETVCVWTDDTGFALQTLAAKHGFPDKKVWTLRLVNDLNHVQGFTKYLPNKLDECIQKLGVKVEKKEDLDFYILDMMIAAAKGYSPDAKQMDVYKLSLMPEREGMTGEELQKELQRTIDICLKASDGPARAYQEDRKTKLLHVSHSACIQDGMDLNSFCSMVRAVRYDLTYCPLCTEKAYLAQQKIQQEKFLDGSFSQFVLDKVEKKYHYTTCETLKGRELNELLLTSPRKELESDHVACEVCNAKEKAEEYVRKAKEIVAAKAAERAAKRAEERAAKQAARKAMQPKRKPERTTKYGPGKPTQNPAPAPVKPKEEPLTYVRPEVPQAPYKELSPDLRKALTRFDAADKERKEVERMGYKGRDLEDRLTLSSSEYVFFAFSGYNTFHTRSCPKARGLMEAQGFSAFQKAKQKFNPCKQCSPSAKADLHVFIPNGGKYHPEETEKDWDALCESKGWTHTLSREEGRLYYSVATGKSQWKYDLSALPIEAECGKSDKLHPAPVVFLSVTDALGYIETYEKQQSEAPLTLNNLGGFRR